MRHSNIVSILDNFTTTSTTITNNAQALDTLLLSAVGFSNAGVNTIGGNQPALVRAMNILDPTTQLLMKYSPTYTCLFKGAQWFLENGGRDAIGGNGKSVIMDAALLAGDDPYRFPDNLPIVNATGGPGGKPSCGSLPNPLDNFPVKYLVTDTGFGTGLDVRPNPGIGFPGIANYFPVTKANPEPPRIRYPGGPAPGPLPAYPGAPPYGAPEYGPTGRRCIRLRQGHRRLRRPRPRRHRSWVNHEALQRKGFRAGRIVHRGVLHLHVHSRYGVRPVQVRHQHAHTTPSSPTSRGSRAATSCASPVSRSARSGT